MIPWRSHQFRPYLQFHLHRGRRCGQIFQWSLHTNCGNRNEPIEPRLNLGRDHVVRDWRLKYRRPFSVTYNDKSVLLYFNAVSPENRSNFEHFILPCKAAFIRGVKPCLLTGSTLMVRTRLSRKETTSTCPA